MKKLNFSWFYSIIISTLQERYTKCLNVFLRTTNFSQKHVRVQRYDTAVCSGCRWRSQY